MPNDLKNISLALREGQLNCVPNWIIHWVILLSRGDVHFGEILLVDREKAVISPVIVSDVVHERALLYIKTIILFYYKNILAKNRLVFARLYCIFKSWSQVVA